MRLSRNVGALKLTAFTSFMLALLYNLPNIINIYSTVYAKGAVGIFFVCSVPLFFAASFNIFLIPFSINFIIKPIYSFLILTASIISYAMFVYGAVFDTNMVQNFLETNENEIFSYINMKSVLWFIATGVLPTLFLYSIKIEFHKTIVKNIIYRVYSIIVSVVIISFIAVLFHKEYVYVARSNYTLKHDVVPFSFLYNFAMHFYYRHVKKSEPFAQVGKDARFAARDGEKPVLMFLVVGESARGQNYSMNGYSRETNPFTSQIENLVSYRNVRSCGTNTATSVPCMFSAMGRETFDGVKARRSEGLLDVLKRAGASVIWKENDGSNCYGVCDRVPAYYMNGADYPDVCSGKSCYDEVLLRGLDDELAGMTGSKLVVFHLFGSHGPEYYKRYPKEFARFSPECLRKDVENCSYEERLNAYDNSLIYTDSLIARLIDVLKQRQDEGNAALLYVSDHGQSLGEQGRYFHGAPYDGAPEEQTRVPMQIWLSDGLIADKGMDAACLRDKATTERYSHDNVFASVLGLWDVQTEAYDPDMDVFRACRRPFSKEKAPAGTAGKRR